MFCMAESVCETVIAHKVLSHWNYLLHFGICSIFPKGSGSEYNETCCREKNTGKPGKTWKKTEHSEDRQRRNMAGKRWKRAGEKDGL